MNLLSENLDVAALAVVSFGVCALLNGWVRRRGAKGLPAGIWVLVALVIIVAWGSARQAAEREKQRIEMLLEGYGRIFAAEFERMGHHRLSPDTPPDDSLYLSMIEAEKRWLALTTPAVSDIYTLRRLPNGRRVFIVDSETDYDHDGDSTDAKERRTPVGEPYDEPDEGLDRAFEGHEVFDPTPITDWWGTWVSADIPLRDPSGKVNDVLGVDYDAHDFFAAARRARRRPLSYMAALNTVILGAGALIALARAQVREQDRAAQKLRESEGRFRSFMDNTPAAAFVKDKYGRYVYVNRAHEKALGNMLGKVDSDLWKPEVVEPLRKHDRVVLEEGTVVEDLEKVPDRDGNERQWWVAKFALGDTNRERQVGGVAIDISEQLKLEEQMLQAQKMETVGQLAAGVAHDFNNILTIILGCSSLIETDPGVPDVSKENAGYISKSVDRAADLVQRLLAFSRQQPIHREVMNLAPLLEDHAGILKRTLGDQVIVHCEIAPGLPPVKADAVLLEQALMNLALNARDAMPAGGKLTLSARAVSIEDPPNDGSTKPGDYVRIDVADTGSGMDAVTIDRIFEPYFTTKEVGKGSGLGLASAFGIAKQHEGWITVESVPDQGSCFHLYVPVVSAQPSVFSVPDAPAPVVTPRFGVGDTVLVVEDDSSVRTVLRVLLKRAGCRIFEAGSANEASRLWREKKEEIDLLVTDMVMPGEVTGRELAERLLIEKPELRVICTTGYSAEMPAIRDMVDDRIALLLKPFSPVELSEVYSRVMRGA